MNGSAVNVLGGVQLPAAAGTELVTFVCVLGRVGPLFALAPGLSAPLLPARAKVVAALALSAALTPIAAQGHHLPEDPVRLALVLVQEVGVGIAFALALAVFSAAVQAGASLLDTLVGFSFGSLVDPMTGTNGAILGQLYVLFASAVFVIGGGVQLATLGLARSYDLVPLGAFPAPSALGRLASASIEQVPLIGLELVAPVLLAVVVADAAVGLVGRAAPQLNVFVVGLPLKVAISFTIVAASLPFVTAHLGDDLQHLVSGALQTLGGG